ncbi:MAG: protein kinase [Xanthomonadales bacterium]|nr:protein kinase [Xanthomonadales bacterium]
MPEYQRAEALAGFDISEAERSELSGLLAADAMPDTRLAAHIVYAAEQTLASPPLQERLGPWRIIREIGVGGMGTVFLAKRDDGTFQKQVAIKLLRGFPTDEGRRRLRQERSVLAQLDHPYIASLIDGGESDDGQPYLVMEYVEGATVTAHATRHELDLAARIELIDRIAEAVSHAHQRLVIHRDLKPANVVVRSDGTPKLLDFGVAKLLDINQESEVTSTRVWTPGYASPEQKLGLPVTTATDVFALGTLMRELLSGRRPDGRPCIPFLGAVRIDADLSGVINKASADQATERYASVEALRDDLARWREGRPLRATPDTRGYRARKFLGRHRRGALALLLVVFGLAFFVWQLAAERNNAVRAQQTASAASIAAQGSAREAQRQLERSRKAIEFLASIFRSGDPDQTLGRTMTVSDLLASGERQIENLSVSNADLRGDFAAVLAQLYYKLGDAQSALRMLDMATIGVIADSPSTALELALRHETRMGVYLSTGDLDQATRAANSAIALRERWAPENIQARIANLWTLAEIDKAKGDLAAAEQHAHEGLVIAEATQGYEPILLVNLLGVLADAALQTGKPSDALGFAERMANEIARTPGIERSRLVWTWQLRARALQALGRMADAEQALNQAIAVQSRLIGDSGFSAAYLINDLGILQAGMGQFERALSSYQRYADLMQASSSRQPGADTMFLNNVCDANNGLGNYALALEQCTRAANLIRARAPADAADRLAVESQYARTLGLSGQYDASLALFDDVIARSSGAFGETSMPVAVARIRASRIALLAGDRARASIIGAKAKNFFYNAFTTPSPWRGRAARLLGQIALDENRLDDAAHAFDDAAIEFSGSLAAEHPIHLQLAADRAELAFRRGNRSAARQQLGEVLPALRKLTRPSEIDRVRSEAVALKLGLPQAQ